MTDGNGAKATREDWAARVVLILLTIVITSLTQTFLTSLTGSSLGAINKRIFRIEVAVERIANDIEALRRFHGITQ